MVATSYMRPTAVFLNRHANLRKRRRKQNNIIFGQNRIAHKGLYGKIRQILIGSSWSCETGQKSSGEHMEIFSLNRKTKPPCAPKGGRAAKKLYSTPIM
jgi:hypothetical protein